MNLALDFNEKIFINFLKSQNIIVKTNTKARGNLGLCQKGRIDVSKNAPKERRVAILAHEYAHIIHSKIEKDSLKNGGCLKKIFNTNDIEIIEKELLRVTHFVDNNSLFLEYFDHKEKIKTNIKELESIIKTDFEDFKRSEKHKFIENSLKKDKSNVKYLLRYDNVKLIHPILRKEELISIKNIDIDFSHLSESVRAYVKLKSLQKQQLRVTKRKNKIEKYYKRPTELFARFVEGVFIDKNTIQKIAPIAFERFCFLLNQNHYGQLKQLCELSNVLK